MSGRAISLYIVRLEYHRSWRTVAEIVEDVKSLGKRESTVWFLSGSVEEQCFLGKMGHRRKWLLNHRFRMITKKDIGHYPFYILNTGYPPRDLPFPTEHMELVECGKCRSIRSTLKSNTCPVFDFGRMGRRDIFTIEELGFALIISLRLRRLIEEANITGVRLVPCVDIRTYRANPGMAKRKGPFDSGDVPEADFYQVVITDGTDGPMQADKIAVVDQCKACGLKAFLVDGVSWFRESDLKNLPFQTYNGVRDSCGKMFRLQRPRTIVSQRMMSVIVQNNIKSLISVNPGPSVLYPVVETEKTVLALCVPFQGE